MNHTDYGALCRALEALIDGERDALANLANASALLYGGLPDLNWAGFYLFKGGELVLGPFQGKPACVRIALGRGVCGAAAERRETVVVPDVHAFPGHIACDGASRSEIVVPLLRDGALLGVLDVDSPSLGRFSDADRRGLEAFAAILVSRVRWPQLAGAPTAAAVRRSDRQETDLGEIAGVIDRCKVLRVGFQAPEGPHIVPMNFGWEMDGGVPVFYMHCALQGRKLDLLDACDRVGFEMDCSHALIEGPRACDYGYRYESVVGTGRAALLDDPEQKARALSKIMAHQLGREMPVSADQVGGVAVISLRAEEFACKRRR